MRGFALCCCASLLTCPSGEGPRPQIRATQSISQAARVGAAREIQTLAEGCISSREAGKGVENSRPLARLSTCPKISSLKETLEDPENARNELDRATTARLIAEQSLAIVSSELAATTKVH